MDVLPWDMVGASLKRARACWNSSLEEVERATGLPIAVLASIERGQVKPDDNVLRHYAGLFRCSFDELRKARDEPRKARPHVCDVRVRIGRTKNVAADRGCSFCGRSMLEVRFSVRAAAHPQARICDDCLIHCSDVIRQAIYAGSC